MNPPLLLHPNAIDNVQDDISPHQSIVSPSNCGCSECCSSSYRNVTGTLNFRDEQQLMYSDQRS
jgi:hypothetical protein